MPSMRRIIAVLSAAVLLLAVPAQALSPSSRAAVLNGVQGWTYQGTIIDNDLTRSGGSCTANRISKPCTSILQLTRATTAYAQWNDGHFSQFASGVLRLTDKGLFREQASTNLQLWSNDWTNAVWTKVHVTATLNATGPDNVANSATTLTSTAIAGSILQTVTLASAQRTDSVWIERLSGSGTVTLVENGATGTACSLTLNVWVSCTVTATQLNPVVGLIFGASGDSVAVWSGQLEALAYATSPIPTTSATVARNGDNLKIVLPVLTTNVGSAFASVGGNNGSAAPIIFNTNTSVENDLIYCKGSTQIAGYANADKAVATLGSGTNSGASKYAVGYDSAGQSVVGNGGTVATNAGAFTNQNTVFIGAFNGSGSPYNGFFKRIAFWSARLSDGQLKALTQ